MRKDVNAQTLEGVRETSRSATYWENAVPNSNNQYRSNDFDELKNQMKNIEIECLKTRMAMIGQNVMSQRLQFFQSYPLPGHQLSPIPGIHIPLVHQPYANITPFPHPYMAPFAHNLQIPFAPPMYGHRWMMSLFMQPYAAPIAQNLLGPLSGTIRVEACKPRHRLSRQDHRQICKPGQTGVASRVPTISSQWK